MYILILQGAARLFFFFFFGAKAFSLTHGISLGCIHYAVGKREKLANKHMGM